MRNWANVDDFISQVYATPAYIQTLKTSTPIAEHVKVDFELRGCPINKQQLVELIASAVLGRVPRVPKYSVCVECKRRGTVCVAVARGIACLGPVTQAGCGAICPSYHRECFGCYGPKEGPNLVSLTGHYNSHGADSAQLVRLVRSFNGYARSFGRPATRSKPASPDRQGNQSRNYRMSQERRIEVKALTRVEGEGALRVRVDGKTVEARRN